MLVNHSELDPLRKSCGRRSYRQPDHLEPARCNSDPNIGAVRTNHPWTLLDDAEASRPTMSGNSIGGDAQCDVLSAFVGRAVVFLVGGV
jgi:hypothetical protein